MQLFSISSKNLSSVFQILQYAILRHTSIALTQHFAKASLRYKGHSLSAENASIRQKSVTSSKTVTSPKFLEFILYLKWKAKKFGFHFFMKSQICRLSFFMNSQIHNFDFYLFSNKIQKSKPDYLTTLGQKKWHFAKEILNSSEC